ncbi:MAG: hypothetical protein FWH36_02355 [Lentimicrobiaceae bacterium]|nr:hypothetical protein [Lentimicrobiaceae bacterium]
MKKNILIVLFTLSCSGFAFSQEIKDLLNIDANETLKAWFDYYKSRENTFSLDNFMFESEAAIDEMEGTICGIFDDCFDPRYAVFLVYSPNKRYYIDFHSYSLLLDENNFAAFDIDTEVGLIDVKNQTVGRIAFFGLSFWLEDVFWKNDSVIVFLGSGLYENSDEYRYPSIQILDLSEKKVKIYNYKDALGIFSDYYIQKLKKIGIEIKK